MTGRRPASLLRRWLPVLAWAAFLLWLGGRDTGPARTPAGFDKVAHFGLYGVLGVLAGRAWRTVRTPAPAFVLACAVATGAADELHQTRVPARTADPWDFCADAAGVLIGFAAVQRGRNRRDE